VVRTVISLQDDEKRWLDRQAERAGTTMTEVVRQAIRSYRASGAKAASAPTYADILKGAKGSWSQGDAVAWVRKLRADRLK
jgi:predicted transcriptional regulator